MGQELKERREVRKGYTVALISVLTVLLVSACTSTQPITEPVAVIEAFYEALNEGDLDTAMSFVADDARFIPDSLLSGKAEIRDYYQEYLDLGYQYEFSVLRADGEKVSLTGKLTIGAGAHEHPLEAVVQEGMIVSVIHQ